LRWLLLLLQQGCDTAAVACSSSSTIAPAADHCAVDVVRARRCFVGAFSRRYASSGANRIVDSAATNFIMVLLAVQVL